MNIFRFVYFHILNLKIENLLFKILNIIKCCFKDHFVYRKSKF